MHETESVHAPAHLPQRRKHPSPQHRTSVQGVILRAHAQRKIVRLGDDLGEQCMRNESATPRTRRGSQGPDRGHVMGT